MTKKMTLAQWEAFIAGLDRKDRQAEKEYQRNFVSYSELASDERQYVREGYDDDHARELAAYERGYQSDVLPSFAW